MTDIPTTVAPLSNAQQISQKIADLQVALQTKAPGYEHLLQTIHVALHKDEELVHLLNDEQVGVIVAALAAKKNIVIADAAKRSSSSGKTASGKKLSEVTLDDL